MSIQEKMPELEQSFVAVVTLYAALMEETNAHKTKVETTITSRRSIKNYKAKMIIEKIEAE